MCSGKGESSLSIMVKVPGVPSHRVMAGLAIVTKGSLVGIGLMTSLALKSGAFKLRCGVAALATDNSMHAK